MADSERADIAWQKSTVSGGNGDCVEIAFTPEAVFVRNSRDPQGPRLSFSYSEWGAFLEGAQHGEFDLPSSDLFYSHVPRLINLDIPSALQG